MPRFLPTSILVLTPAAMLLSAVGCSDDVTVDPTTSSTTASTGGSGAGATTVTTSTVGGGGTGGAVQGGGGTGGTGGSPPMLCMGPDTGTDTCDGEAISLSNGDNLTLCGDLTASADDYQSFHCGAASASGDNVYNLTVTEIGTLTVRLRREAGSALNPTMYARFGGLCTDASEGASAGCWSFFDTHEEFATDYDPAIFGPNFHLFVDGGVDANNTPTTGGYELEITLTVPACGDGVLNYAPPEECDDGNTTSGDGCSSACVIETTSLFDQCPGEPVIIVGSPASLKVSANTIGNADDYVPAEVGSCSDSDPDPDAPNPHIGGQDRIYKITPDTTGTLTATVGLGPNCMENVCASQGSLEPGCWDYVLWATGPGPDVQCGDTAYQLGCADTNALGPEAISFPVAGGESYFVIVDGYPGGNGAGPFNLCLELN